MKKVFKLVENKTMGTWIKIKEGDTITLTVKYPKETIVSQFENNVRGLKDLEGRLMDQALNRLDKMEEARKERDKTDTRDSKKYMELSDIMEQCMKEQREIAKYIKSKFY